MASILALLAFGYTQMNYLDHSWPDIRPNVAYLSDKIQSGSQLLINNSWSYIMYLYSQQRISDPWQVYDVYRLEHEARAKDICQIDWLVDEEYSYSLPSNLKTQIEACHSFEEVYSNTSYVSGLRTDLKLTTSPVRTTIWRNTAKGKGKEER